MFIFGFTQRKDSYKLSFNKKLPNFLFGFLNIVSNEVSSHIDLEKFDTRIYRVTFGHTTLTKDLGFTESSLGLSR